MTLQEAKDHYRTYTAVAKALGLTRAAVSLWNTTDGKIPEEHQLTLHKITKGKLKADPSILTKYREILRAA